MKFGCQRLRHDFEPSSAEVGWDMLTHEQGVETTEQDTSGNKGCFKNSHVIEGQEASTANAGSNVDTMLDSLSFKTFRRAIFSVTDCFPRHQVECLTTTPPRKKPSSTRARGSLGIQKTFTCVVGFVYTHFSDVMFVQFLVASSKHTRRLEYVNI